MKHQLLDKTREFVKQRLQNTESGHDWLHIERVYQNALQLIKSISCNKTIVLVAVLVHDLNDSKFNAGKEQAILTGIKTFLRNAGMLEEEISQVENIIENMSFRHSFHQQEEKSIEFQIVQDADRLDAIGAIGIARAFSYGGYKQRAFYDETLPAITHQSSDSYQNSKAATISHFYEKLLLLKDQMNTPAAKKLAEKRHRFMLDFLKQFDAERFGKS
ncbi:MAG: HD domain-containing protein [Bacteroidales bacterium]|jgi:uncharacterized protein|nr:HD domain-containing protein [Bacteroidales bacterium]